MKALVVLAVAVAAGMAMTSQAEPVLNDITTFEAYLIDQTSAQTLAFGGPWEWQGLSYQMMTAERVDNPRIIVIKCRDAGGKTIFGGMMTDVILLRPPSPMDPPHPSGTVTLDFFTMSGSDYTVSVFLDGTYFLGEMIMFPVADDPVPPPPVTVAIDIKPDSAENPFNVQSQGLLPVALLGSADVSVSQIDLTSIKLAGVAPVRSAIADLQSDGYPDAVLHFQDQDISGLLTGVTDGEIVMLKLTGVLLDGTSIEGTDVITVKIKKPVVVPPPKKK
jgi:hypothetical protein